MYYQASLDTEFRLCLATFPVEIATITYSEETNQTIGHILTHKELDVLLEKCGVAKKPEPEMSDQ